MSITLTPETQRLVEERMKVGGFTTPDELVRLALETFEVVDLDVEALDHETQAAIARAEEQSARGEGIPAEEAFERLRQKHFHD